MAGLSQKSNLISESYARQLVYARRLAKFKNAITPPQQKEQLNSARLMKRKMLVEQVAREILENLIATDSENEIVQKVQHRLQEEFGEQFAFTYPPEALDMRIFRVTDKGPEEVTKTEAQTIYSRLWVIIMDVVDRTMV